MTTKALTGLALVTALSACGGGGGGGDGNSFTPIQVSDLGSISTTAISNGFASAIQQVAGDGLVDAKESLSIFKWVDANENINTTELAKYNVTVNGTKMTLQRAWFMLKGYKKLYYDGKETFWQNMVDNKQYDDTDSTFVEIKAIALKDDSNYAEEIGKGGKTVDQFKKDKGVKTLTSTATNTVTTDSDPVVGDPAVTTTYVDATADTVLDDGRTKRETTRTYTHTSKTPSTVTTTTYTQYVYTYSDGTTNIANGPQTTSNNTTYTTTISTEAKVISTTYIAASVVETDRVDTFAVSTTEETTNVVGNPVVTTTYSDKEDSGVVQENGDTLYTTTRTFTDKSTVTTDTTVTTIQTSTKTTTITYSNGTTEAIVDSPVVTKTPVTTSKDTVTTSTRTEVLSTRIVKATVVETGKTTTNTVTTSDAVSTNSDDTIETTYVDVEDSGVVQGNGDTLFTTTRTFTDKTITTTTTTTVTTTNTTPVTTITYSNGTTETVTGETVITTNTTTSQSVGDPVTTTRTEIVSTRIVNADNTVLSTNTFEDNLTYSHLDKTFGSETTTTKDIITYSGTKKTTTRRVTKCTVEFHEHFDKRNTITRTTYKDGSVKDVIDSTEYFTRGKVNKGENCTDTDTVISVVNTDDGVIGDDHKDMGTRTPGYNSDATTYETNEYNYIDNKQLSVSNFSTAYSRGWTGKGSLVTIADTGANTNHVDLDDNIKYTIDYTGTGISNSSSHGTHVAGITAGEKNNTGMHGAAFDANLAIAKVSSGNSYSFATAKKAAAWGRDKGSVAINVSAEVNYDSAFRNSIVKKTDGNYYSTHWYYGMNGYNGAVNEASGWKSALGNEQVLVKAAGNAGWDYSAGMNQMATATDADGNLILDGQMIVVGNYDTNNGIINSSSNKAGTVCATYNNNVCIDAKKIKDFYIMADGTNVTSTAENGSYVTMTGTSMAAPVVTGSIAILHQMWPHMKGKYLVQLVLVTGNKNIAGYNENVHGQGLLDMDKATRPVGATGIPTTGRTNGGVSNLNGGANVSGVASSQIQALTSVMVLDSFERDFYIDLGDMTQSVDTRTISVAEQMGAVNYYKSYMNTDQHITFPKYVIDDNSNIEFGFGASDGHYLGNSFSGTLGTTLDSSTLYANYNYANGGFYAQAGLGYSTVNFDTSNSLLSSNTANVISSTATVGYEVKPADGHKLGFNISQPVTIEDAKLNYTIPTSRTLDGKVNFTNSTVNFKNDKREIDIGTYYTFNIQKTGNSEIDSMTKKLGLTGHINTFAEIRTGVSSIKKEIEKVAGISVQLKF